MKRIIPILLLLLLVLSGCEYLNGELPESICIKTQNLTVSSNASSVHIEEGQIEAQLKGCEFKSDT